MVNAIEISKQSAQQDAENPDLRSANILNRSLNNQFYCIIINWPTSGNDNRLVWMSTSISTPARPTSTSFHQMPFVSAAVLLAAHISIGQWLRRRSERIYSFKITTTPLHIDAWALFPVHVVNSISSSIHTQTWDECSVSPCHIIASFTHPSATALGTDWLAGDK